MIYLSDAHEVRGHDGEGANLVANSEKATAHIGCRYRAKRTVRPDKGVLTQHTAEMENYHSSLVEKIETK